MVWISPPLGVYRGLALADFFRLDKGKVVEHWDVIQPVPGKSANQNTMFWARSLTRLLLVPPVSAG